jgi:hypothetical protein
MTSKQRRSPQPLSRVFAIPMVMGVLSAFGLVAALVGDNVWDAASWLALGVPIATITWCYFRTRSARENRKFITGAGRES